MKIKQLFCNHLYKTTKFEYLYDTIETQGLLFSNRYAVFAWTRECLKCGKKKIVRSKRLKKIDLDKIYNNVV